MHLLSFVKNGTANTIFKFYSKQNHKTIRTKINQTLNI